MKISKHSWWNIAVIAVIVLLLGVAFGSATKADKTILINDPVYIGVLVCLFFFVFYAIYRYRKTPRI